MRWTLALLVGLAACAGAEPLGPIPPAPPHETRAADQPKAAPAGARDAEISGLADELESKARELEPSVTPVLAKLAAENQGAMAGLEHRFKSRRSMERKIRQRLSKDSAQPVASVVVDDALRYTIVVDDQPRGHYVGTVRTVLSVLEGRGHTVRRVKNYWPRGDNYSGVNSVLRAPNGLEWELQFHTRASLRTQKEGHRAYEEMRRIDTPIPRKRELFGLLAAPWDRVAIPGGALVQGSLHPQDRVIRRDPPR